MKIASNFGLDGGKGKNTLWAKEKIFVLKRSAATQKTKQRHETKMNAAIIIIIIIIIIVPKLIVTIITKCRVYYVDANTVYKAVVKMRARFKLARC